MARALTLMTVSYCSDVAIVDPPEKKLDREAIIDFLTAFWAEAIGLIESSSIHRERNWNVVTNQEFSTRDARSHSSSRERE